MSQQEAQIYAKGGFAPRPHGGRRDKSLLPDFLGNDGSVPEIALLPQPYSPPVSCELLGTYVPTHGYCAGRLVHCWAVTLASGLKVPAYSLGQGFNVCQHTGYKARQG